MPLGDARPRKPGEVLCVQGAELAGSRLGMTVRCGDDLGTTRPLAASVRRRL